MLCQDLYDLLQNSLNASPARIACVQNPLWQSSDDPGKAATEHVASLLSAHKEGWTSIRRQRMVTVMLESRVKRLG